MVLEMKTKRKTAQAPWANTDVRRAGVADTRREGDGAAGGAGDTDGNSDRLRCP